MNKQDNTDRKHKKQLLFMMYTKKAVGPAAQLNTIVQNYSICTICIFTTQNHQ